MKLKYQLLILGMLSLLLPLTGWIALKSVDKEFRHSVEQASKNTLLSLQASVKQLTRNNSDYKLHGLVSNKLDEIIIDGDDSDWIGIKAYKFKNKKQNLDIKIASINNKFSLFIKSNDSSKNTSLFNESDHIIIGVANTRGIYKYNLNRQAEGIISANDNALDKPRYQAYWHELANGYTLEIQFENNNFHHLGFASVNVLEHKKIVTGSLQIDDKLKLQPLVANNSLLQAAINEITPVNNYFSIKDQHNRIIYQSDKLPKNQTVSAWQWLITPVYQWLFGIDENSNWYYRQADGMAGISQTLATDDLIYTLKSMMPQGQQSMIQTLLKASVLMIAVVFLIMLSYLLYSSILAWRIKKLNYALQTVLDASGKLHTQMPSHLAKDEIGQLSRGIETMLAEMQEYTKYLKDFGTRLSHEMKTPLAIVQTSLDNIELEQNTKPSDFLQRARLGTNRLKFILNQLSELSQLKHTLESTPKEEFNLTQMCQQLAESYQSYIPQLKITISSKNILLKGSSELMAQLLDKLMDNAKDFTASDGTIEFKLIEENNMVHLSVVNTGSQLPDSLENNIFDSLSSSRTSQNKGNSNHLGLGLYIAQLISKYHDGQISANNLKNPKRVEILLQFKQFKLF